MCRTFNDLSGKPLARLRLKGKWLDYVAALLATKCTSSVGRTWREILP